MKIMGINHKTGTFNGKDYDNYQLFGVDDSGEWSMVKVSSKIIEDSGVKDVKVLKGNNIEILYNKYGNVAKIRLV